MAISRNQLVKELEPGLNALFGLEYKQYEQEHAEIYNTAGSANVNLVVYINEHQFKQTTGI